LQLLLIAYGKAESMDNNAHHPDHIPQATVVIQLGGIFLALGMATTDIVDAIKSSRRS
jgi:hypothetical protein